MGDVWLILCAAAAMCTALPALKRLDAAIAGRLEQDAAGGAQADETERTPEAEHWEQ